jgi:GNAT superfamily N-acetyltransferase
MSDAGFRLDGYTVVRLTAADEGELQDLFVRCSDFHELAEGVPTPPGAASEELVARPPGTPLRDKFSFGISAAGGGMVGYLDLIRNHPAEGEWWIGLLMLEPAERGAGLGSRVYRAAAEWVARQGGTAIHIGVLEHNPKAERFWRRQGFQEVRRVEWVAGTGRVGRLIIMVDQRPGSLEGDGEGPLAPS